MASWLLAAVILCARCSVARTAPSREDGFAYLEENAKKDGVVLLPSGLQYKVLRPGTGNFHPTIDSPCDCHYAGTLVDGTEFDSSYKRGQPATFAPNQVIGGWTEAMQLMVEGDKWQMIIPPDLAYGDGGSGAEIPGGSTLIFTMELLKIKGDKIRCHQDHDHTAGIDKAAEGASAYSWNIFRYIADYLHLIGVVTLLLTFYKNQSVAGVSKGTQIMYLIIFCSRYLDLVDSSQTPYLVFFKLTYIITSALVLWIFWKFDSTYESRKDTCSLVTIVAPCFTAAVLLSSEFSFMEVCWTFSQFLEGFAMVPQYIFCYRDKGGNDVGVSSYVVALGGYRVFYALSWIYKKIQMPQYSDIQSWIGGVIEILFFIDFLNFRFTGHSMLRIIVLSLDEKVNEIQDSVQMKVLGSSSRALPTEEEERKGLRRRGGGDSSTEMTLDV